MKYTPDYQIEADGVTINFLFNDYTLDKYTDIRGMELEDLYESVAQGKIFRLKAIPKLLLVAAESYAVFNDEPFNYKEKDAYDWIKAIGGYNSPQIVGVYKAYGKSIMGMPDREYEEFWNNLITEANRLTEVKKEDKKKVRKIA